MTTSITNELQLFGEIKYPLPLIQALRQGTCVIFAGAGVSMGPPSNYPNFKNLVQQIAKGTILEKEISGSEPFEKTLGRLDSIGVKVHHLTKHILINSPPLHSPIHTDILRLFSHRDRIQLVTTNFDRHFTSAYAELYDKSKINIYAAPALPVGSNFKGIVHLHGSIDNEDETLVLTDRDFGRAYLTEAWAARFLVDLYGKSTVLFIGYSHKDTIVSYLARGFGSHSNQLYALDSSGESALWEMHGIIPLHYRVIAESDHSALNDSLRSLADDLQMQEIDHVSKLQSLVKLNPPKIGTPEDGYLRFALTNALHVRFFCSFAKSPDWCDWLKGAGFLDRALSSNSHQDYTSQQIGRWFAHEIALKFPHAALLHLPENQNLNSTVVEDLWYAIRNATLDNTAAVGQWVPVLIRSTYSSNGLHAMAYCLEKVMELGLRESVGLMLLELLRPIISIKRQFTLKDEKGPLAKDEYALRIDIHEVQEFISSQILPNISHWGEFFLMHLPAAFLFVSSCQISFDGEDTTFDTWSFSRSGIELDVQDQFPQDFDILITLLRESIQYLLQSDSERIEKISRDWIFSKSQLLRRFRVFFIDKCYHLNSDEKILFVQQTEILDNPYLRREVFALLKSHYPPSTNKTKSEFLSLTRSLYYKPGTDSVSSDYSYFNILSWLDKRCEGKDKMIRRRLSAIKGKNKQFQIRERPDLLHYSTHMTGRKKNVSILKAIRSKSPTDIIFALQKGVIGKKSVPARDLLEELPTVLSENSVVAYALLSQLCRAKNFESRNEAMATVVGSIQRNEPTLKDAKIVLSTISKRFYFTRFQRHACNLLKWCCGKNNRITDKPHLNNVVSIIAIFIKNFPDTDVADLLSDANLNLAIVEPGWEIGNALISCMSGLGNKNALTLPKRTRSVLNEVLSSKSRFTMSASISLLYDFNFLLPWIQNSAEKILNKLLDAKLNPLSGPCWNALFQNPHLSDTFYGLIKSNIYSAVKRASDDANDSFRGRLIDFLVIPILTQLNINASSRRFVLP